MTSGYTAAANELAFGARRSHGDACGRCFKITATADPYSSEYKGPFGNTIITVSHPVNQYNMTMQYVVASPLSFAFGLCDKFWEKKIVSFDLCSDSGASAAFFPKNRGAMVGVYEEVSCNQWAGSAGQKLWNGACLAPKDTAFWPSMSGSCGNEDNPPA
ncbi:hypothetical protein BC826DRAFT_1042101 [Russula brevipes]|nr:hypothetical protein BC826DRAFT_1042101 [Russula brevipes]